MLLKENSIRKEKYTNGKNRYYIYVYECIGCKKELKIQASGLKRHSGKCMRCTQLKEPYKYIYNELRLHKNQKVNFELSFEEFINIIKTPECHYCGKKIEYKEYSREWGKTNSRAHQLDRKNNEKGYSKDNVVCCCWTCNRLKSNEFTYEEFLMLKPILEKIRIQRESL